MTEADAGDGTEADAGDGTEEEATDGTEEEAGSYSDASSPEGDGPWPDRDASRSDVGFTWGETEDLRWLRSPDGDYKRVEPGFLETLRALAAGDVAPSSLSREERRAVEHLADEGFLVPDEPVRRAETPPPVALGPRLLAFAVAFAALTAYVAYRVFVSGTTLPTVATADVDLLSRMAVALPIFAVLSLVHEAGHYRAASPYFDPSVEFSLLNGVFPAIVTGTNDAWRCPRSVRVWISLAGPFVDCCQCLALAAASLVLFPGSQLLAVVPVFQYLRILFALNPLLRGDGYWTIVDWFGATNLHSRGLRDLRNARPTGRAAYAAASGAFSLAGVVLLLFVAGRLLGVVA